MTANSLKGDLSKEDARIYTLDKSIPVINLSKICWRNLFILAYFHTASLYAIYLIFTEAKWQTIAFVTILYIMARLGVTAGLHRLWAHRSYKANTPLKTILMFFTILAFEGRAFVWVRDHRVHHKYQETDADPHNAARGFWFSHIGWSIQRKHPMVAEKGKGIDVSDLYKDKLIMFQKKYFWQLMSLFGFFLPTIVPNYFWGESLSIAWHIAVCLRIILSFHATFLINSAAHLYGNRPYDVNLYARENRMVSVVALGEGWHNYHHAFPWDYKAAELGNYRLNLTTAFIDFFAKIGWAYELKTVPPALIRKRALKMGDGTYQEPPAWGWNDKDLSNEEKEAALILNRGF
uniref:Fatty acid desaturase domain-containing protein n=1 Tax=Clastoptera arizonana TaxID=38151 RepID=A0A1B6DKD3_9HEMI